MFSSPFFHLQRKLSETYGEKFSEDPLAGAKAVVTTVTSPLEKKKKKKKKREEETAVEQVCLCVFSAAATHTTL